MVKLTRAQMRPGVKGVDVTVKSSKGFARSFAPTWKMVMGYKNGTLTEAQYTEQYMKILGAVSVEAWRWLYAQAVNGEVVLLCYCRDGEWTTIFCHTHLIMQLCHREVSEGVQQKVIAPAQSCVRKKQAEFCPILSRTGRKPGQSAMGRIVDEIRLNRFDNTELSTPIGSTNAAQRI